jgi:O-antigen/teichoic acid export membrane protein
MSLSKRFFKGFSWNLIGKFAALGTGLLISVLIARGLGASEYGLYASVMAVVAIVPMLFSFGLEQTVNVQLPKLMVNPGNQVRVSFFIKRFFILRLLISTIAGIVLYFFAPQIAEFMRHPEIADYLRIGSFYIVFTGLAGFLARIYVAELKLKTVVIIEVISQILSLSLIYSSLKLNLGITGLLYVLLIISIFTLTIYLCLSKNHLLATSHKFNLKEYYGIGVTAWLIALMGFALGREIDILLLNYYTISTIDIGFYNLSFGLVMMLGFFTFGLGPIAQSVFSERYAKDGNTGLANAWQIIIKVNMLMIMPFFFFSLLKAKSIFNVLYGVEYIGAYSIFLVFVLLRIMYVFTGASYAMPVFYLIRKKQMGLVLRTSAGLMNLILDIILIPIYGVMGAVFATGFSMFIIGLLEIEVVLKNIPAKYPFLFVAKLISICLLALVPSLLITGDNLFSLVLAGIIYVLAFVFFMAIFKPIGDEEKELIRGVNEKVYKVIKWF